jgi:acyl carrier protein
MSSPQPPEIEEALRRFIVEELLEAPFDGEDPLAAGEVDSLGVEQLVEYAFEVWGAELDDEEIIAENFESIAALAAVIGSKV